MSKDSLSVISPVNGNVYVERPLATADEIEAALQRARSAGETWRRTSIDERARRLTGFVDAFIADQERISEELTWQMGRPLLQNPNEVRGFEERARHMIDIAATALQDIEAGEKPGFTRFIRREPLGTVLVVAAWNYPYLIAVNAVVPALMAGNAVILKHSAQTPLCAERFADAFNAAGLPEHLFQVLHMSHAGTAAAIQNPLTNFVAFTGSVPGGAAIQQAVSNRFIATGLELGGKDPAYVRADCDFEATVENLVDGAFYNAGQSCCGIERIYVARPIFDRFVDAFTAQVKNYSLGDPTEASTTLGPMVRTAAAELVRTQIADAVRQGARTCIDPSEFPANRPNSPYLAPQVLVDVTHEMSIMRDETFGPAVGIMAVDNDDMAVKFMNDSNFGLTASVWTEDQTAAMAIGERIETGTMFMNRCDYLDPALAWVGVKESGRGCTLSPVGYESLTRPKSYHFRTAFS